MIEMPTDLFIFMHRYYTFLFTLESECRASIVEYGFWTMLNFKLGFF